MTILIVLRYKKRFIPFAFLSMALFHLFLWKRKRFSFYKLMGCGKNGTFDIVPDLKQWAIFIHTNENVLHTNFKTFMGKWYCNWIKLFKPQQSIYFLNAIEGHGEWDKKQPFGSLPKNTDYNGKIAVLTRATIRLSKLKYFWKNVAPVANDMVTAPGFITSYGIGEVPWIKQATFSIWDSKEEMRNFAYKNHAHKEVIKKTHQQKWYSEDMFVRFKIIDTLNIE